MNLKTQSHTNTHKPDRILIKDASVTFRIDSTRETEGKTYGDFLCFVLFDAADGWGLPSTPLHILGKHSFL